jgi:hypothetical protein
MDWFTVSRRSATTLIAGVAAVVVAAGAAYAAASSGPHVVAACVSRPEGELYLASPCRAGDRRVTLGVGAPTPRRGKTGRTGKTGPRGATGAAGQRGATGGAGPQGAIGPKGDPGATGPQGAAGANGVGAYVTGTVAGPLSTSSASATDLGGPSVTLTVPPSGLVEIYAGEASAGTGGHSDVFLYEDGNPVAGVECDGSSPGLIIADDPPTSPPTTISTTGTSYNATTPPCGTDGGGVPTSLTVHAGSGSHTFKLEYAIGGGPYSTTFTDSFLSIAPRP